MTVGKTRMVDRWRAAGTGLLAAIVELEELPGRWCKSVVVEPGDAAVVVYDGEPRELVGEGRLTVASPATWLRYRATRTPHITILFFDAMPLELTVPVPRERPLAARQPTVPVSPSGSIQWLRFAGNREVEEAWSETLRFDVEQASWMCHLCVRFDRERIAQLVYQMRGRRTLSRFEIGDFVRQCILELPQRELSVDRLQPESNGDVPSGLARLENTVRTTVADRLAPWALGLRSLSISREKPLYASR